ncbi:MAG: alkaline phosphatase [Mycobacterium sp.]|nr:alkaline phosphatase [Mycobacterium sp.]
MSKSAYLKVAVVVGAVAVLPLAACGSDTEKASNGDTVTRAFSGLDALPLTGQYTTYALQKNGKPNYVTDSAASATSWSTGTKTYNGALGIDIKGAPRRRSSNSRSRRAARPATSPPPRSRTRRRRHCSPTSPNAIATGLRKPPRTASPKRWRTAGRDR